MMMMPMIRLNLNDNVDGLVGVIGFRRRCRSSLTCSSCLTKIVLGWLVLPSGSREAAHQSPSQADSVSLAGSSGWSLMLIITVMLMMREEDDHLTNTFLKRKSLRNRFFSQKKLRKKCVNPGVIFGLFGVIFFHFVFFWVI